MPNKAEHTWGYAFGVEGVLPLEDAAALAGVSKQTIWRLREKQQLRIGKHKGNVRSGKAVVCRRSLNEYLKSIELGVAS